MKKSCGAHDHVLVSSLHATGILTLTCSLISLFALGCDSRVEIESTTFAPTSGGTGGFTGGVSPGGVEQIATMDYPFYLRAGPKGVFVVQNIAGNNVVRIDKLTLEAITLPIHAFDVAPTKDLLFFSEQEECKQTCPSDETWIKRMPESGGPTTTLIQGGPPSFSTITATDSSVFCLTFQSLFGHDIASGAVKPLVNGIFDFLAAAGKTPYFTTYNGSEIRTYDQTLLEDVLMVPANGNTRTSLRVSGGYLYWHETNDNTLWRSSVGNPQPEFLLDKLNVFEIEVDTQGTIFAISPGGIESDGYSHGQIVKVGEPGQPHEVIVSEILNPRDMEVDDTHIYWVAFAADQFHGAVYRMKKP